MNTHRTRGRRAALAATTALALLGVAGVPALAAGATIDPSATATLTVHKFAEPVVATGLPHDGTELPSAALGELSPLAGVEMSVQKVPDVDLTTNDGWQLAGEMDLEDAQDAVEGVTADTRTTGADGRAVFSGLPLGLYLVTETGTPAGAGPAAPFLVTLPLSHPTERDSWLYDVHVYPKNPVSHASIALDDSGAVVVGDEVTWTVTGDIPNGGRTDAYHVSDPLPNELTHVGTSVALSDGTPVVLDEHYTLTHEPLTNTVHVRFLPAGLDLLAANTTLQVVTKFTTRVETAGTLSNFAAFYPNQLAIDEVNPFETGSLETRFGNVTVQKVDEDGDALAGATFQMYRTLADAKAGTNAVVVDGDSSWTSDADGLLTIPGLRNSNHENGSLIPAPEAWRHYWLAEVQAPTGYALLAHPVQFDVLANDTTVDVTVENVPTNAGFTLPLTGANGTALIVLAGSLLLGGAILLAVRSRAQKDAVEA